MAATRFRTKAACRIARISPERFNEAVAANNYPCAPRTDRGSARVFDMTGLITLFIYGRLLEYGFPPSKAGPIACKINEVLIYDPTVKEAVVGFTSSGHIEAYDSADYPVPRRMLADHVYLIQRMAFDIENIRTIIQREMDEENSIGGEDDEPNV